MQTRFFMCEPDSLTLSQTSLGVAAALDGAVALAGAAAVVAAGAAINTDDQAATTVESAKPQVKESFVMDLTPKKLQGRKAVNP
jgi:hypothetical protein